MSRNNFRLPRRWEDISDEEAGGHYLAIASYSLSFDRGGPVSRIFGREHICHPMSDVLYNRLYDPGIYADVQVLDPHTT